MPHLHIHGVTLAFLFGFSSLGCAQSHDDSFHDVFVMRRRHSQCCKCAPPCGGLCDGNDDCNAQDDGKLNYPQCIQCYPSVQEDCVNPCTGPSPSPGPAPGPGPAPPPPPPPPTPETEKWPKFSNDKDLRHSPWGTYFNSLYGELPPTPIDLSSFWCFYIDKMNNAGAKPPKSSGTCPKKLVTGERYDENNMYSSKDLTWLWHDIDGPPFGGFQDHWIVEVSHQKDPFGDEHFGMWFMYAAGSGVYLDIGKTHIFNDHGDAFKFFGAHHNEDMCQKAAAQGYDSVQFIKHHDSSNYPCAKGCGVPYMNIEIVAVKLTGTYQCGQPQGTASALRAGWGGHKPCKCDPTNPNTNCVFSMEGEVENSTGITIV